MNLMNKSIATREHSLGIDLIEAKTRSTVDVTLIILLVCRLLEKQVKFKSI